MPELTYEQGQLLDLALAYFKAHEELEACKREAYESGYFCSRYRDRKEEAGVEFFAALDAYVRSASARTEGS